MSLLIVRIRISFAYFISRNLRILRISIFYPENSLILQILIQTDTWVEVQKLPDHLKQQQTHFSDSAELIREEREICKYRMANSESELIKFKNFHNGFVGIIFIFYKAIDLFYGANQIRRNVVLTAQQGAVTCIVIIDVGKYFYLSNNYEY